MALGYLGSYQHMGSFSVECVAGCACEGVRNHTASHRWPSSYYKMVSNMHRFHTSCPWQLCCPYALTQVATLSVSIASHDKEVCRKYQICVRTETAVYLHLPNRRIHKCSEEYTVKRGCGGRQRIRVLPVNMFADKLTTTQVYWAASQHEACQLKITSLPYTESGEHKVKFDALMVATGVSSKWVDQMNYIHDARRR